MKRILTLLSLLAAIGVTGAVAAYLGYGLSKTDAGSGLVVEIPPGSSFNSALNKLSENGLVGNKNLFKLYAAVRGDLKNVKPGEYRFDSSSSRKFILDSITKGNVITYKITVPEGTNMYQIADMVSAELKLPAQDFIAAASDPALLTEYGISGPNAEGYLYPETYFLSRSMSARQIVRKMIDTFFSHYRDEITEAGKKIGLTQKEIIILASIIEKETGQPHERRLISSVFHNRLKRGMRLQSDPTTIYGIWERYRGNLTKKDLLETTPYNTYKISGMPVGPIANPGIESIEAAVNPEKSSYLYFVARKDKTHVFANTLVEHNANVKEHQLNQR